MKNATFASLEKQGNVYVLTELSGANRTPRIRRIDGNRYVNLSTGEVGEVEHKDKRTDDTKSLRRTFATIRGLVNANAEDPSRVLWITLTYAENMTDCERLYKDFVLFWHRCLYWHKKNDYPKPEYLTVVEPQGRGAWHHHLMLFYPCEAIWIPKGTLERLWGNGFVSIKTVKNITNLGAYLSAYLSNIQVDASGFPSSDSGGEKSVIKGSRLSLYPAGMRIFRASRGIKRPVKWNVSPLVAQEIASLNDADYESNYSYTDEKTGFAFSVHRRYYHQPDLGEFDAYYA